MQKGWVNDADRMNLLLLLLSDFGANLDTRSSSLSSFFLC